MGLHGDSQVAAWSDSTIAVAPVGESLSLRTLNRDKLPDECRSWSQKNNCTEGTGALGIGSLICGICPSIFSDKRDLSIVNNFQSEYGCCFSSPAVLERGRIIRKVLIPLSSEEKFAMEESKRTDYCIRQGQ